MHHLSRYRSSCTVVPDLYRGESRGGRWDFFGKDNVWWGGYMIFSDAGLFFVLLAAVLIERWLVYRTFARCMMGWGREGDPNRTGMMYLLPISFKVWKDQRGTYARYVFGKTRHRGKAGGRRQVVPGFVEVEKRRGEKRREKWEWGGSISETNRLQRRKLEIEREREVRKEQALGRRGKCL